jgi:hypothetical protein
VFRHFVGIVAPISSECVVHVAHAFAHAIDQSLISCLCEEETKFSSAMSGLKMKMRVSMLCEWLATMLKPHLPNQGRGFDLYASSPFPILDDVDQLLYGDDLTKS